MPLKHYAFIAGVVFLGSLAGVALAGYMATKKHQTPPA